MYYVVLLIGKWVYSQSGNDYFRPIIYTNGDNTVAHAPADDHCGVIFGELTCIILRE
jgi:hypothetical protein